MSITLNGTTGITTPDLTSAAPMDVGGSAVLTAASSLAAANLTGALPAISGAALTGLSAGAWAYITGANLASGAASIEVVSDNFQNYDMLMITLNDFSISQTYPDNLLFRMGDGSIDTGSVYSSGGGATSSQAAGSALSYGRCGETQSELTTYALTKGMSNFGYITGHNKPSSSRFNVNCKFFAMGGYQADVAAAGSWAMLKATANYYSIYAGTYTAIDRFKFYVASGASFVAGAQVRFYGLNNS